MSHHLGNSELLLQADRYFNHDMLPEEHAAFEKQLATDLAAQEALSQIVLIQQSLQPSESVTSSFEVQAKHQASRLKMSSRVVALLTTSLALFFVVWIGMVKQAPTLISQADTKDSSEQQEAMEAMALWALMGTDQQPVDTTDETHAAHAATDIDVPDWMLVAVEASDFEADLEIMDFDDDEETL